MNRIDNFKGFMENLENASIVEMTNPNTRIKSSYLIIRTEESKVMQLGIKDIGYEYVLETFLVEKDNIYFRNTSINEPIISIQKYNDNGELEPFSFRENTNETLDKNNLDLSQYFPFSRECASYTHDMETDDLDLER